MKRKVGKILLSLFIVLRIIAYEPGPNKITKMMYKEIKEGMTIRTSGRNNR